MLKLIRKLGTVLLVGIAAYLVFGFLPALAVGGAVWLMWPRQLAPLLTGLIGAIVLAVVGMIIGACYGGNYATDFEFNDLRGYEATGHIGGIFGLIIGGAFGAWLGRLFAQLESPHAQATDKPAQPQRR